MSKRRPTEPFVGWGLRVGGGVPYLGSKVSFYKEDIVAACRETYHRPVRVAVVPLAAAKAAGLLKEEC